jgi:hypothetical protein
MATLAALVAEIEADIDAIVGGTRSRMSQDYSDQLPEFTVLGQTKYQIQASYLSTLHGDSLAPRSTVELEVFVHHALTSFAVEQAYQVGQMATDQLALIDDSFWESMTNVYALVEGFPAVNVSPERTGKRITYSVGVRLQIA